MKPRGPVVYIMVDFGALRRDPRRHDAVLRAVCDTIALLRRKDDMTKEETGNIQAGAYTAGEILAVDEKGIRKLTEVESLINWLAMHGVCHTCACQSSTNKGLVTISGIWDLAELIKHVKSYDAKPEEPTTPCRYRCSKCGLERDIDAPACPIGMPIERWMFRTVRHIAMADHALHSPRCLGENAQLSIKTMYEINFSGE